MNVKRFFSLCLVIVYFQSIFVSDLHALQFSIPQPTPSENQSIPIIGSGVHVKGLTHQTNKIFINARETPVQRDGTFQDEILIPLGETEIVVEEQGPEGARKVYKKKINAQENHFFLAGIADGTLNFSDATAGFSLDRDGKSINNGFEPDGKISYYMVGKLQGKYLFKSALDTAKGTQEKLFTSIDPDKYYPIYGDNSTVVYDINSQKKLYVLFEWEKSGLVLGNYQTQIGEEGADLISYNRTLVGAKVHLETPKRTVYGDPVAKQTIFLAEANQSAGHSEFLGSGSLYYLRHRNIAEGSEQVVIETRDKMTGIVLQSSPQTPGTDYEIKYDEGRITFRTPVYSESHELTSDTLISQSVLSGNPQYIVVNYEFGTQEAFPIGSTDLDDKTGGVRVSQHFGDHLRAGFTYVKEKKDEQQSHDLVGFDATAKIGNFTKVNAQIAHSDADTTRSFTSYDGGYHYQSMEVNNLQDGKAFKVEANSTLGEYFGKDKGFLDVSGYWQKIDSHYAPVDTLYQAGTEKWGIELAHELSVDDKLRLLYQQDKLQEGRENLIADNFLQAEERQALTGQWIHVKDQWTFTSEYQIRGDNESLNPNPENNKGHLAGHIIAERVDYRFSERTSLFIKQQMGLTDLDDSFTSVGGRRQLTDKLAVYGEAGGGPLGNSVLAGLERNVSEGHNVYTNFSKYNSALDGRSSVTSFGSNQKIGKKGTLRKERQMVNNNRSGEYASTLWGYTNSITPELSMDMSMQRRDEKYQPSLGVPSARDINDFLLAYVKPDQFKAYSKTEYRMNSDDTWQILLDNQAEWKATQDIFLFGEHEYSQGQDTFSKIDKKQAGLAFRPVKYDWFNALFKYIRLNDFRPEGLTSAEGGFTVMKSWSDTLATEFAFDLPYRFQLVEKLAFKDEDIEAADVNNIIHTPDNLLAFLWVHRLNYHLTNKIDIAAEFRSLRQRGALINTFERGILTEVIVKVFKNIGVGGGFNFTAFTDDLTSQREKSDARGFFLRLQGTY